MSAADIDTCLSEDTDDDAWLSRVTLCESLATSPSAAAAIDELEGLDNIAHVPPYTDPMEWFHEEALAEGLATSPGLVAAVDGLDGLLDSVMSPPDGAPSVGSKCLKKKGLAQKKAYEVVSLSCNADGHWQVGMRMLGARKPRTYKYTMARYNAIFNVVTAGSITDKPIDTTVLSPLPVQASAPCSATRTTQTHATHRFAKPLPPPSCLPTRSSPAPVK